MAPKTAWKLADENKMVDLLKVYPCLWDMFSPQYSKQDIKAQAYQDIADELDKTGKTDIYFVPCICIQNVLLTWAL